MLKQLVRLFFFLLSEAKYKANHGSVLKILTSKQMHQIALAQLKAGNTSENLLTEIRQIIYSLYRAKEITKKLHNNVMNSIKLKKNGYDIYEFWKV